MHRQICALLIAFAPVVFISLSPQAAGKTFTILGVGNNSCGSFIDAVDHDSKSEKAINDEYDMLHWAQGYLTHFNFINPTTINIAGGTDSDGVARWLKNYCRANPLVKFSDAVNDLTLALWPTRRLFVEHH